MKKALNWLFEMAFPVYADAAGATDEKIKELEDELIDLNARAQTIQATADAEKRELSEDEEKEIKNIFDSFERIEEEINRRKLIADQTAKLLKSAGRKTDPQPIEPQNKVDEPTKPKSRVPRVQLPEERGKWGWKNMGEFAMAVRAGSAKAGSIDPRLVMNAPSTYSTEGVGSDGGFAVPPDFRTEIWQKVSGEETLFGMTDQNPTGKNTIVFPKDETTPWDSSGGIQAYFESEAAQLTQSKVKLGEETIRLNKLTALVPVSEELLEDAPGLDGYLRKKVSEKFDFKLNLKILQGQGAGEPLGVLNAPSLVSVAKETSQTADTINYKNIMKMYSRMYAPCRRRAVWLINQDIEPQLMQLALEGSAGGLYPLYVPPGGLSASPYGTIMGRPVMATQACETLGDKGDIIFADLSQYMTAYKTGGVRTDVSMHLWFDYDVLAYRFILRVAGQPWWTSYITPRDSTNYLSWAVTLDERG